jgi:HEAT repeat protein
LLLSLLVAVLGGTAWWMFRSHDANFHGKRESEWIKAISYNGNDTQTQQWRELGPEGLRLLSRTLDRGRFYRKAYRWTMPRLPGALNRVLYPRLPKPEDDHATRMCVISLLSSFGKDAKPVESAIARALDDDDSGVRLSALGCYETGLLEVIGEKEKAARLPAFLRAMQDNDWGIRNNAAVALWFYTNQAQVVVPVLVTALQDPDIHVRLFAAKALVHIDVHAGVGAGVVPIVIKILKDPDDQVAHQAAQLLGEMGKESTTAVPALIESIHGTNGLVAHAAARALKKIDPEAAVKAGIK